MKEQDRLEVESELEENQNEFDSFTNYINTIQSIHQVPVDRFDWNSLTLSNENLYENFSFCYLWEIKNKLFIDYELAILHLSWLVAVEDKKDDNEKFATKDEDNYLNIIAKNEDISIDWKDFNSARELLNDNTEEIVTECIRALSKAPLLYKIKALGYMKKMAWVSQENDEGNNMSDKEWELIRKTSDELGVPLKLMRISQDSEYIDCSTDFISNAYFPNNTEISEKIPELRPSQNDAEFMERHTSSILIPIKNKIEHLINSGKKSYGNDWIDIDYRIKINLIEDQLKQNYDIVKDKSFIGNFLFKSKIEHAKSEITKLETEKESLVSTQSEKSEVASYIELLNDIKGKINNENSKLISYWNDTWSSELQDFFIRKEKHEIATKVLDHQSHVYSEAIKLTKTLTFIQDFGSSLSISYNGNIAEIDFFVNINDVVPTEKKVITQSRKLSYKPFTDTERNILIQDYVCSSSLRIAKELFLTLPINNVIIHAYDTIINSATGNNEDIIMLSVEISESNFSKLNLDKIDPSDAIEEFNHKMKFTKSNGFGSVEKIKVKSQKKKSSSKNEKESKREEIITIKTLQDTSNSDAPDVKFIKISSSITVKDLQNQFKELFDKDIVVLTSKGNSAGENRKLRALTEKDIKSEIVIPIDKVTKKALKEIKKLTGLNLDY